jgi:integrase
VGREKRSRSKALQTAVHLPSIEEVRDWLRAVREKRGYAKYLACRFILEVGPRNHEVAAVTVDQWPSRETVDWLQSRGQPAAVMELTVTKGSVPRDVMIPIELADEVCRWIDGPRLRLNTQFYKRTKEQASKQLFLSDARGHEGIPVKEYTIYRCFHEVKPRPPHWAPHLGRHAYACFYVLQALELDAKIAGKNIAEMGADWVMNRGDWWLKTLRRQLGHVSEETTEIYLRWLMSATQLAALANGWHQYLNAEDL